MWPAFSEEVLVAQALLPVLVGAAIVTGRTARSGCATETETLPGVRWWAVKLRHYRTPSSVSVCVAQPPPAVPLSANAKCAIFNAGSHRVPHSATASTFTPLSAAQLSSTSYSPNTRINISFIFNTRGANVQKAASSKPLQINHLRNPKSPNTNRLTHLSKHPGVGTPPPNNLPASGAVELVMSARGIDLGICLFQRAGLA